MAKQGCRSKLSKTVLSENEKLFVELYFTQSSDTFGNGTQSIIEALGEKEFINSRGILSYDNAARRAHDWLRLTKIYEAGNKLIESQGFNDSSVDSQHSFVINQSAELGTKLRAIDIYNKLKGRYEIDNKQRELNVTIEIDGQTANT